MIYRSNLVCPDLAPRFKHLHVRPMPHSFGHSVPSDWADKADDDPIFGIYKKCGLWTHDEAAILYHVAQRSAREGWLDIGAHTGWTSAHISEATGEGVDCVDPMLAVDGFDFRFTENAGAAHYAFGKTSNEFFSNVSGLSLPWSGVCIDGDHEPGKPLEDAKNAAEHLADDGVIIFHDALGRPVRDAAQWLMQQGFKCRWYSTPHGILLCWRGDFTPPDHVPDPNLPDLKARCPEFPFERTV